MQYKKDEIRLKILLEAEKEFLEKGFDGASLRKIVKKAGTSIGNFYNYFENKEELFEELVKEEYTNLIYFLKNHNGVEAPNFNDILKEDQWKTILASTLYEMIPRLSNSFVLLFESSKGTKFENIRQEIVKILKEHFIEHMLDKGLKYLNIAFADLVAEQCLNGIIYIIKKHKDVDVRKKLIVEHLMFYIIGVMSLC
ncbi:TetR/AcrR family transcriptional regulator [Serpentinicella alkaliphila]|uniref:TetR family transcriptional regulator n=1 Tax=Serpentinicella alkaliphila TaxID=1734049 RepID=A0A4R2U2U6_9FIRM|nr:TetR/AcrR family transcriptional regulator [Serpentinicella alkaliphila]QUH25906.1 TetR/AcrR family transcriptional regulator [Serpentinicella alkaliphila]TCQ01973.1 TetR family transcriptional regulator [Serpentinicella alkaliphila]